MPPSCALLGRFAIGARVALLCQHSEYVLVLAVCLDLLIYFPTVFAINTAVGVVW